MKRIAVLLLALLLLAPCCPALSAPMESELTLQEFIAAYNALPGMPPIEAPQVSTAEGGDAQPVEAMHGICYLPAHEGVDVYVQMAMAGDHVRFAGALLDANEGGQFEPFLSVVERVMAVIFSEMTEDERAAMLLGAIVGASRQGAFDDDGTGEFTFTDDQGRALQYVQMDDNGRKFVAYRIG